MTAMLSTRPGDRFREVGNPRVWTVYAQRSARWTTVTSGADGAWMDATKLVEVVTDER